MEVRTLIHKQCHTCKLILPIFRFDTNGYQNRVTRSVRKYHAHCKLCTYHQRNIERDNRIILILSELGKQYECERCGENNTEALDFHHLNPLQKEININKLTKGTYGMASMERLRREINKCIVLCACCHRKEHKRLRQQKTQQIKQQQLEEHKSFELMEKDNVGLIRKL